MYTIGQISEMTGITAYTLRYYEKIGILPNPDRANRNPAGVRRYSESDLRFIRFIHGLKQTGMKLEDIASFVEDGCLLSQTEERKPEITGEILRKRMDILDAHLQSIEEQIRHLKMIGENAREKRIFYANQLHRHSAEL